MANKKTSVKANAKEGDTKKKKNKYGAAPQRFLPIAEIKEDLVVLKNGGLRAVLIVTAINFNLKSDTEQEGIIAGYQSFVNTLSFPIQIVIRSDKLNIDPYIAGLKELGKKQENALLKKQTLSYANFIEKLINVADIMQKKFYIVVPMDSYSKPRKNLMTKFFEWLSIDDSKAKAMQRRKEFNSLNKTLRDRMLLIESGLENIGVTMRQLNTSELVQLYYSIYNPYTSQKQKLDNIDMLNIDKTMI